MERRIHHAEVKVNGEIEKSIMVDGIEFRDANNNLMLGTPEESSEVAAILNEFVGKSYTSTEALKQAIAEKAHIGIEDVTLT